MVSPHRTSRNHALSYRHVPVSGFKRHECYKNLGPVSDGVKMLTIQSESDMLAELRNSYGIDHYNPRHVPTLISRVEITPDYVDVIGPYQAVDAQECFNPCVPMPHDGYYNWHRMDANGYVPIAHTWLGPYFFVGPAEYSPQLGAV